MLCHMPSMFTADCTKILKSVCVTACVCVCGCVCARVCEVSNRSQGGTARLAGCLLSDEGPESVQVLVLCGPGAPDSLAGQTEFPFVLKTTCGQWPAWPLACPSSCWRHGAMLSSHPGDHNVISFFQAQASCFTEIHQSGAWCDPRLLK